jgi:hypothetical protein
MSGRCSDSELPEHVQKIRNTLLKIEPDYYYPESYITVALKLTENTPELVSLWRSLQRQENRVLKKHGSSLYDDLWVRAFLESAHLAYDLPPYHFISIKERDELSAQITKLSNQLARLLKVNGLDPHIIFSDGIIFNGFYIFEDFGWSNRARIEESGTQKLKVSELIDRIAERSREKILEEPLPGKAAKNAKAIRFIRIMAQRNLRHFGKPLNRVVATAANVLFDTLYTESSIRKLLSR